MPSNDQDHWIIFHFSQHSARGRDQADVPSLLRRVADSIAELGEIEVQDVTFRQDVDDDGEWWPGMTVYYHRP